MEANAEAFSEWLGKRLKAQELTQRALAERIHTSESHLSYLLSGTRSLTADHCITIAYAINESPTDALVAADLLFPEAPDPTTDPTLSDIWRVANELSPEARRYVVAAMKGIRDLEQQT